MAPKAQWPKPRKSGVKPQSGWMTLEPLTFTLVEAAALEARGGRPQQSSWSSTGELLQEQRPLRRSSPWCPERQRARLAESLPSMLMAQRRTGRSEDAAIAQIPVLSCAHVQPRPGTEQRLAFVHWGTSGHKSERSCGAGPPTLHPLAGRPFAPLPEPVPRSHSAALLDAVATSTASAKCLTAAALCLTARRVAATPFIRIAAAKHAVCPRPSHHLHPRLRCRRRGRRTLHGRGPPRPKTCLQRRLPSALLLSHELQERARASNSCWCQCIHH